MPKQNMENPTAELSPTQMAAAIAAYKAAQDEAAAAAEDIEEKKAPQTSKKTSSNGNVNIYPPAANVQVFTAPVEQTVTAALIADGRDLGKFLGKTVIVVLGAKAGQLFVFNPAVDYVRGPASE